MEDGNWLTGLADGPHLLLILEHIVEHLLLAGTVASADAHHECFAVVANQVDVYFLEFAEMEGLLVGLGGLGGGDGFSGLLHVEFNPNIIIL